MPALSSNESIPDILLAKKIMLGNMNNKKMFFLEEIAQSGGRWASVSTLIYCIDEMIRVATEAFGTIGEKK